MYSSCFYYPDFFFLFLLSFLTSFMASAQSPASSPPRLGQGGNYVAIIIAVGAPIGIVVLLFIIGFIAMTTRRRFDTTPAIDGDGVTIEDSLQLDFRIIQAATHNFSGNNKLGQGEFGEVYKGTLFNGVDIAVKRLSKSSGLSEVDFKDEVVLVAKLQHRNLVRLLGFCLEGDERILVYECLPNKSLEFFLFDPAKKSQLDWTLRHKIIEGTARAMLYLHQDSQLTVIHCDLKASNILLDAYMNPKVANVGMARLFGIEKSQENTSRTVGTYDCMFPEFAMRSQFSMKSHVYSFGVLLLEIISGRKNSCFFDKDDSAHDLVTYAWRLWRNGTPFHLVDPAIGYNYQRSEVMRCIQVGLLCVQEDHEHRPMFSTVVMMLTSNTITLPEPREIPLKSKSVEPLLCSVDNDASITNLYPR